MSPAWIRKRKVSVRRNPRGVSYQVLWRYGGAGSKTEAAKSAGSFTTEKDAKLRRDLVAGWLAQGKDPRVELAKLHTAPVAAVSFAATVERMIATRHDAADSTIHGIRKALAKVAELAPDLAGKPAAAWTVADAQDLVAAMVDDGLAASTVLSYMTDVRIAFDFADASPNPARDRRVKLPAQTGAEVQPPTAKQVLAILALLPAWHRLILVVLEQTAMRIGELASLPWGDVDVAGSRFRLSRERTKTRRPRWVQVPEWLMAIVAESCPLEDRTADRPVFPRVGPRGEAFRAAMAKACRNAQQPVYSPHDLRHRRISLWHGQGIPAAELAKRAGHSKASMSLDTYSHVMPLDELAVDELERLLAAETGR